VHQTLNSRNANPSAQQAFRYAAPLLGLTVVLLVLGVQAFRPGVIRAYDWALHSAWIEGFYQQMALGTLWPQWLAEADGGRGAPVFVFYPPLAYWLASAFRALTDSSVAALELTELAALVLLYGSCYRLFRLVTTPALAAGLAAVTAMTPAILFVTFRVHMMGASLALAAFPWVLHGLLASECSTRRRIVTVSLAFGLIGWTHLLSMLMTGLIACVFALSLAIAKTESVKKLACVLIGGLTLGVGLALAPLWPSLTELSLISIDAATVGNLNWTSNFLFSLSGPSDGFRLDYRFLAIAAVALLVFAAAALYIARVSDISSRSRTCAAVAAGTACIAMTTPISAPVYAAFWPIQVLQFPWRWLPMAAICMSLALAASMSPRAASWRWIGIVGMVSALGYGALLYDAGSLLPPRPHTTAGDATWATHSAPRATPEYRPRLLAATHGELELADSAPAARGSSPSIRVTPAAALRWRIEVDAAGSVGLGIACYPGWQAYLDGQPAPLGCDQRGLLEVALNPTDSSNLELRFETPTSRLAARFASCVSGLVLLALALRCRSKEKAAHGRLGADAA